MLTRPLRTAALTVLGFTIALTTQASAFVLPAHQPVYIAVAKAEQPVVTTALQMVAGDFQRVLDATMMLTTPTASHTQIIAGSLDGPMREYLFASGIDLSRLSRRKQAFVMALAPDDKLIIAGSDAAGTAYGLMELSRMVGVSPWEWWADVTPQLRQELRLDHPFRTLQAPSVEYRGIFINDEDWGLLPWASNNHEPNAGHAIGPKTTERIFQLMLRLRANLYWPPMHPVTKPFFLTEGCAQLAQKYGIFIGTSHCEPMGCNAASEWATRGKGEYNFMTNAESVLRFWQERVQQTQDVPMVYTLGMRGLHDGPMQGANTPVEQKAALTKVIAAQRDMLATTGNNDMPQVFTPYKEVLDAYNQGLQVPDDVILLWPDDNYGYIRHFPTEAEAKRSGGNGVYYHISYWGRPHDYLWLGTASPYLLYQQLSEAYYHGARRMWVLNVGDIKPSEYQIQLFMDMAWNLDAVRRRTVGGHMEDFFVHTIGRDIARLTAIYMKDHYHLSFQRKPEHLAGTRVGESRDSKTDWNAVRDLPWSEKRIRARLSRYDKLQRNVNWIADSVRRTHPDRYDAFFQLVEYPVMAAIAQNEKYLTAQLARHGKAYLSRDNVDATWRRSDQAHQRIQQLTQQYNNLCGGKWRGIMDANPRQLSVFKPVPHTTVRTPMVTDEPYIATFYGASYSSSTFSGNDVLAPVLGLGASIRAMPVPKDCTISYSFDQNPGKVQDVDIELHMLPTHPIEQQQRVTVTMDGSPLQILTYDSQVGSEQWKQNVLQGYTSIRARVPISINTGRHTITIGALDDGVVVDQIFVRKATTPTQER